LRIGPGPDLQTQSKIKQRTLSALDESMCVRYLDALTKIKQHASAGNALLILRLERFNEIRPSDSALQNLHVNISSAVLGSERATSHCMFDDEYSAIFTADANQLLIQHIEFWSVLKIVIFGSVNLIVGAGLREV
jgi:hypothetical protein